MQRTTAFLALASLVFVAADWTRFRGPDARGVANDTGLPTDWTATDNVVWKTPLPGFGASSPITLGDKIFLTCYAGYGLDQDNPGDQGSLQHLVLCMNRSDGKVLWARGVKPRLPRTEYQGFIALHGYASATPATDGQAVYAFFGRTGVLAFGLDGKPLWRAEVGDRTHSWGSGASPVLHKNLVIVNASVESGSLVALDKESGKEVWRASGIERSWSTPLIVDLPDGGKEVVVNLQKKVFGFDPDSGEKLWECAGINDYVVPSVIAHEGIVYVTGGRQPNRLCLAVRAAGRGDVTNSHVLWTLQETPKVGTPVYHDGYLYWINQLGSAVCVHADSGKLVYKEDLGFGRRGGDKVYASLVLADGKLFGVSREDGAVVLKAGPQFEELARNRLDDDSIFNATPVVSNGQLLIRSDRFLYCIGD